jgi:hypothetical protein
VNQPDKNSGIENEQTPAGQQDGLEREAYLEERKTLVEAEGEASQSLDRALITLSAGAFGLSLAFIIQVAPEPKALCSLYLAWGGFIISLLSILLSFLASQQGFRRARDVLDTYYQTEEREANGWDKLTGTLNVVSIISFILGVVSLAYFAVRNLT